MFADGEIAPLEDVVVTDIITHEDVLRKYLEEVSCTQLLLILRTVVENHVTTEFTETAKKMTNGMMR